MDIELPQETSTKIEEASQILGINKETIVDRAILLFLDNITKYLELKKEFKKWDFLSDESFLNFEKNL